jgi:hypothetical protein
LAPVGQRWIRHQVGRPAKVCGVVACHQPFGPAGALRVAVRLVMVLVGLAAAISFTVAPVAPATADPLNSAQATAAELSQEVLGEAGLVHQLSVRYESDRAEANFIGAEVAGSHVQVANLERRSHRTESLLREEALFSYTDEVPAASAPAQFGSNLVELAAQKTYLALTLGDVSATVVQLQGEQTQLGLASTSLRREYRSQVKTETMAAQQRDAAISEAATLEDMLVQARNQVALLTSEQHAQAGLPVGNGVVNAVNQQLGSSSSGYRTTAAEAPSTTTSAPASTVAATPVTTTVPDTTTVPVTTVPVTTVPVTTAPAPAANSSASGEPAPAGGVWLELRECESGDNYQEDTGNGFYGAYQFAGATWSGLGLPGLASEAPYWEQDEAAERLQAQYGWKPWPACSAALGL